MSYEVGQIIYVLSGESDHIVPMQICEEIRRRTIAGEEVTYLIKSGPDANGTFRMDEIKGKVFNTIEQAKVHLTNNFTQWLDKQVEWTQTSQKTWYKTPEKSE
jgi:poly(3-hydroxyalkanoate) synthetase